MAKYTYELREVISTFGRDEVKSWFEQYELSDFLSPEEIAVINEKNVWDKDKLSERILDHYFTREIGTDAIGQFMLFVKDRMNEIMEIYAPVIYSASLKFEPLSNNNYEETFEGKSGNVSTSQTDTNGNGLTISSDTPQGKINKSAILNGDYATATSANENENSVTGNTKNDGTEEHTRKVKGTTGVSEAEMIRQYRNIIRAINTEIVYELEPLFMGIY